MTPWSANLNNGLVANYSFNGNANDESGNGNNGTVNGAVLTADRFGNVDSAYYFDGLDGWIEGPTDTDGSNLDITGPFTLDAWIKFEGHLVQLQMVMFLSWLSGVVQNLAQQATAFLLCQMANL